MSDNCPVCQTRLEKIAGVHIPVSGYDCPRCGKFRLNVKARGLLSSLLNEGEKTKEEKIAILSHAIRKMQKKHSSPKLDYDLIIAILKNPLPSIAEQADNLIIWFAENLSSGEDSFIQPSTHQSIVGAKNPDGFAFILKHLLAHGLLDGELAEAMGAPGRAYASLSFDGWQYYEELKRGDTDKQNPFTAKSVPKEQTNEIHDSSNGENTSMEWDVFICHASEDKENFVEPLANALTKADIKVWYDRFELKLGDSLRDKIDDGLANSRYGVVVLSISFFKKDWPKTELDALVSRQNIDGGKVILPIWHGIGVEEVSKFSPILASKLAAQSSDSLESIVIQIENVLNESSTPQKPAKGKREIEKAKKRRIGLSPKSKIDNSVSIGPGLESIVQITRGSITYRSNTLNFKPLINLKMSITGEYIKRNDFGKLEAYIQTEVPFQSLQRLNERLGLDSMRLLSESDTISMNADKPIVFTSSTSHILPKGEMALNLSTWQEEPLPMNIHVQTQTTAFGHLKGKVFQGKFEAILTYNEVDLQVGLNGDFQVHLA